MVVDAVNLTGVDVDHVAIDDGRSVVVDRCSDDNTLVRVDL